jgi:Zn-dependent peptidase ImmA (M78 family)
MVKKGVSKKRRNYEHMTSIPISKETKRKLINIKNNKGYKTIEEAVLKSCNLEE